MPGVTWRGVWLGAAAVLAAGLSRCHPAAGQRPWRIDAPLLDRISRVGLSGCTCAAVADGAALTPAEFHRRFVLNRRPAVLGNLTSRWSHATWADRSGFIATHGIAVQWERWAAGHRQAGTLRRPVTVQVQSHSPDHASAALNLSIVRPALHIPSGLWP